MHITNLTPKVAQDPIQAIVLNRPLLEALAVPSITPKLSKLVRTVVKARGPFTSKINGIWVLGLLW